MPNSRPMAAAYCSWPTPTTNCLWCPLGEAHPGYTKDLKFEVTDAQWATAMHYMSANRNFYLPFILIGSLVVNLSSCKTIELYLTFRFGI
jgi:hypothetical protein